MTTLKFKCKLESDVILNQKAATEGPNQTLDFIPGSCFLGIVASELYEKIGMNEKTLELFHSGKVRFGDAHPSNGENRGLKIPASMSYPKLKKITDGEIYIHHAVPNLESDEMKQKQLKQCRNGFYTFDGDKAIEVKTETNFAIKSAYDKEKRRSEDNKMYGYESLQKGLVLLFDVEVDNEDFTATIKEALTNGKKRVGRSRTAQYGLVEITYIDDKETNLSTSETIDIDGKKCVTVYADCRLIFLDKYGLPTFRPTVKDLGLEGGEVLWDKSQIRTFQYAPWNYKRQCFDADRCGIEKGSVFVVDVSNCSNLDLKSQYVGSYNNEGFGKVIYNPEFLRAEKETGKALVNIEPDKKNNSEVVLDEKERKKKVEMEIANLNKGNTLLQYLANQKSKEELESEVYAMVNEWVANNWKFFKGDSFASQWGTIRSIAMKNRTKQSLSYELFDKMAQKNGKTIPNAYLTHGVAADKWKERGRLRLFRDFFERLTNENAQMALVNLAAEMAKKCRKEDK